MSRPRQRLITVGGLLVAAAALVLAAVYQGDRTVDGDFIVGAGSSADTGSTVPGATTSTTAPLNPVEGFLPRSGEASACLEPVGVDLAPGYAATLTINGIAIAEVEMNVTLDASGQPTDKITASRTLGQYTFGPEEGCPNARVLRATNNLLQACVYRLEEGPASCVVKENSFDVL